MGDAVNEIYARLVVDAQAAISGFEQAAAAQERYVAGLKQIGSASAEAAALSAGGVLIDPSRSAASEAGIRQVVAAQQQLTAAEQEAAMAAAVEGASQLTAAQQAKLATMDVANTFREQAQLTRRQITESMSITGLGSMMTRQAFGTTEDLARVRSLTREYVTIANDLRANLQGAGITSPQIINSTILGSPDIQRVQAQMDTLTAKTGGFAGFARAAAGSFLQTSISMLMIVPEMALITGAMQMIGSAASDWLDTMSGAKAKRSIADLGDAIQGAGDQMKFLADFGSGGASDPILRSYTSYAAKAKEWEDHLTNVKKIIDAMSQNPNLPGDQAQTASNLNDLFNQATRGVLTHGMGQVGPINFGENAQQAFQQGGVPVIQHNRELIDQILAQEANQIDVVTNHSKAANDSFAAWRATITGDSLAATDFFNAVKAAVGASDAGVVAATKMEDSASIAMERQALALTDVKDAWKETASAAQGYVSALAAGKNATNEQVAAAEKLIDPFTRLELVTNSIQQQANAAQLAMLEAGHAGAEWAKTQADDLEQIALANGTDTTSTKGQLAAMDRQAQARQIAQTRADMANQLSRDSVAQAGDTAFDVGARLAEDRAQNAKTEQDLALQELRNKLTTQDRLETAYAKLKDDRSNHNYDLERALLQQHGKDLATAAAAFTTTANKEIADQQTAYTTLGSWLDQWAAQHGETIAQGLLDPAFRAWVAQFGGQFGIGLNNTPNASLSGGGGSFAAGGYTDIGQATYIPGIGRIGEGGPERLIIQPLSGAQAPSGPAGDLVFPSAPIILDGEKVGLIAERRITARQYRDARFSIAGA